MARRFPLHFRLLISDVYLHRVYNKIFLFCTIYDIESGSFVTRTKH